MYMPCLTQVHDTFCLILSVAEDVGEGFMGSDAKKSPHGAQGFALLNQLG